MDAFHYDCSHTSVDMSEDFLKILQNTIPQELPSRRIGVAEVFTGDAVICKRNRDESIVSLLHRVVNQKQRQNHRKRTKRWHRPEDWPISFMMGQIPEPTP